MSRHLLPAAAGDLSPVRDPLSGDPFSFPRLLLSAAATSSATYVASLHAAAVKLGIAPALRVSNALISAYARAGSLSAARRAFDLSDSHDTVSYNSIISAHAAAGDTPESVALLRSMQSNGLLPNAVSYTAVISGLARRGHHREAISVFRQTAFEQCAAVAPDADMLSCVISCIRHSSEFLSGRAVHGYGLKNVGIGVFYASAGAALLTMYAACGKIAVAKSVFRYMDGADVVTWNSMIAGFVSARLDCAALDCFREMRIRDVRINARTVATVMRVCDLGAGKQVHGYITRNHGEAGSIIVWNALVSMYSRAGCVGDAERVFLDIRRKDVVSWNTMIGAYALHGQGERVLELVNSMAACGTRPDPVTFTSVLMACCHSGFLDVGLGLFQRFVGSFGLAPTIDQCACIMDLLARAGRLQEAVEFIGQMPMRPNANVWGALLSASRTHHNVEFARMAFEQLVWLEPENPGNFVTMSNVYAKAGRLEDAKTVRLMIDREDLVKPSGYSSVEAA